MDLPSEPIGKPITMQLARELLRKERGLSPEAFASFPSKAVLASESGEGSGTPLQYSCLENPRTEEPGRLQSMGSLRVGHDLATSLSLSCIGKGNGNPLQCSCLENPRDGGPYGLPSLGSHRVGHD